MDESIKNYQNGMKYKTARYSLLLMIILSVVNLFSIVFADSYYLFSSYITQILAYCAFQALTLNDTVLMVVFIAIGIVSVVPYILCYIFSKNKIGWMIAAMVMFGIDTAIMLVSYVPLIQTGEIALVIFDIIFHIYALGTIIACVVYGLKLKKTQGGEELPSSTNNCDYSTDPLLETRIITISKKKQNYGFAVECICCIDGKNVGTIKNGEEKEFTVDTNAHSLVIIVSTGFATEETAIQSGNENKSYEITYKFNFFKGAVPQITEK